jgi:hypothetical protein
VPEPVLPLRLFKGNVFVLSSIVSLVVGVAMFGAISYIPLFLQVANGASATDSGLLLLPLMLGLLATSIMSGQLITRTGRYKHFPIMGTAIASLGLFLLSTLDSDSPQMQSAAYMLVLGLGVGMVMQVLVIATQNTVHPRDLGVATSSVSFFRSVGGSVGVALFGAIFNARLANSLSGDLRAQLNPGSATPQQIRALPAAVQHAYVHGFSDALIGVFLYAVPIVLVGFVLTWFVREVPLRRWTAATEPGRPALEPPAPAERTRDAIGKPARAER